MKKTTNLFDAPQPLTLCVTSQMQLLDLLHSGKVSEKPKSFMWAVSFKWDTCQQSQGCGDNTHMSWCDQSKESSKQLGRDFIRAGQAPVMAWVTWQEPPTINPCQQGL